MKKKIESPSLHVVEKKEALNVAISDENPKASEEVMKKEISEKVKVSEENKKTRNKFY